MSTPTEFGVNFKNLSGKKFGRLLLLHPTKQTKQGHWIWLCQCDCGNQKEITGSNIVYGRTTSCGCVQRERASTANKEHGLTGTTECRIWQAIKNRTSNRNGQDFDDYGGRGITVCERWSNSFQAFLDDMGERPDGMSLDRINNDLGYFKENCRWATKIEQMNNTRGNHRETFNGETRTIAEWSRATGIKQSKISRRLRRGWTIQRTLETV